MFQNMRIHNWTTDEEVIRLLNLAPPGPEKLDHFKERYWAGPESKATSKRGWRAPDTISRTENRRMGDVLAAIHLRELVEEWLETGWNPDGSEEPSKRTLAHAWRARYEVEDYLEKCPSTLSLEGNDLCVHIAELSDSDWKAPDFFEAHSARATRLFVGIVASDWKERLCRCRYTPCGCYFLHPKPRRVYRSGIFCCLQHQKHGSAAQSTSNRRSKVHARLVDYAAAQLREWRISRPEWQVDRRSKARLAKEISKYILKSRDPNLKAYRLNVKVNWVTHNAKEIERQRRHLLA